ncbi:MAG TPA: response regulator [Xanthomonadales bacterium]|nr:response regulator [Xanthomonadales bacterium]
MGTTAPKIVVHVVDDDSGVRCGFSRLLRSAGLEARCHESAKQFLAEVSNLEHACILLDITMPEMSGPEVQAALNQCGITLPVIAVSAHDDPESRTRAHAAGAKLFLRKPVDDQALLDAIHWVTQPVHRA